MSNLTPTPWRLGAVSLLLALSASAAQAQSSYTLSVLKAPSSPYAMPLASQWAIDSSQQVTGPAWWFTTYNLNPITFKLVASYDRYVTRWAASTSSSVSPTKLYTKQWDVASSVSPNGRKVVLTYTRQLYDATARTAVPTDPAAGMTAGVTNDGVIAVNVPRGIDLQAPLSPTFSPATWRQGAGLVMLPQGQAGGGVVSAINASGTVAGAVLDGVTSVAHAALWSAGALQLLPEVPGQASQVLGLNDPGQALLMRARVSCPLPGQQGCTYSPGLLSVRTNGQEQAVDPGPGRAILRALINGSGVVVGHTELLTGQEVDGGQFAPGGLGYSSGNGSGRAFIWANGVFSDLTTVVAGKGAKLPSGAILTNVLALNDQGSLVAVMKASDGVLSVVRLTAKP
jgi:hypothetical protein